VKDIDALEAMTKALYPGGDAPPKKVLVTFEREAERLVTVVELGRKDDQDESVETRPAWLAVGTQVLTKDVAEALGAPGRKGVRITRVDEGSTAEKAGLQVGDLVVAVDDTPLEASQPEQSDEFAEVIRQYTPNDTVALTLVREGKPVKVDVRLATAPVPARELKRYRDDNFEFTARDTSYDDTTTNRVARGVSGVMVDNVSEGGWAALGRLQPGDVILSVNGKPTPNIAALETIMKGIAAEKPKTVVLHVARRARQLFVEMEADWSSGL
jgi:S1-C subfamily serine protease